jgi:hypothetical protein
MWINGVKHGIGTMKWTDKNQIYIGEWKNGVQVGFITISAFKYSFHGRRTKLKEWHRRNSLVFTKNRKLSVHVGEQLLRPVFERRTKRLRNVCVCKRSEV